MANELHKLIREAFNTAYSNHKTNKLDEGAKEKGEELSRIDPAQKSAADAQLAQVIKNPDNAMKIQWSPQGSKGLSTTQLNYIIDSVAELFVATKDEKYKRILSYIYSPFGNSETYTNPDSGKTSRKLKYPAIYSFLLAKLRTSTPIDEWMREDPEAFSLFLEKAWGRIFAGGTIIPKMGAYAEQKVDLFEKIMADYKDTGSNFGAAILEYLFNDTKNLIRKEARQKGRTVSMDTPMHSGQAHDQADDTTDAGSDIANNDEDAEAMSAGIGAGEADDDKYKDMDFNPANFKSAIKEIVDSARIENIGNEGALLTLEEIAINHLSYADILSKHPQVFGNRKPNDLLRDLIFKNKNFQILSNTIMEKYSLPSLTSADFQWIYKAGKETAQQSEVPVSSDGSEDDSSHYTFEEFVSKNMDKIMERVYKRLAPKLNS